MTSPEKIVDVDAFFRAVSSGSVDELKKIVVDYEPEETTNISNSFNDEGETPLIVAIKGNNTEMVRFLVRDLKANFSQLGRFTWKGLNYEQVPPLFAAIMCNYIPYRFQYRFLIVEELATQNDESPIILDLISSSAVLTRSQKIDILELVGTAFCLRKGFHLKSLNFAMRFWSEAQSLRRGDCSRPPIPKIPKHLSECARRVFGNVSEFTTEEELEDIFESPLNQFRLLRSECHLQALLMIHRIMSQIHPDPHLFFLYHLLAYGERLFLKEDEYNRAVDVMLLAVESFPALSLEDETNCQLSSIVYERAIFGTLQCVQRSPQKLPLTTVMEVLRSFSDFHGKFLRASSMKSPKDRLDASIAITFQLIANMLPLNQMETMEVKQWLFQCMHVVNRHTGVLGPLHLVCLYTNMLNRSQIIRLLLEVGANPMALDQHGNSPSLFSCFLPWRY